MPESFSRTMSGVTETTTTAQSQSEEVIRSQQPGELQNIHATYRLNGRNYLKWSQLVRIILKGKGKIGHIMGTGPGKKDPLFGVWDEEDSMIMAWLWNSMNPEISDTCMFLSNAKEIWDTIQQTYSKAKDAAQVYDVKVKTIAAKQGSKTVTEYANQLKSLWQELDHYRVIKTKCPEDAAVLKDFIEQDRIYDFLVGLNPEFDQVRIQILGKQEIPCFNEVVAIVRSEKSRRGLMLDSQSIDGAAMVVGGNNNSTRNAERSATSESGKSGQAGSQNRDNLWCSYCKKSRHTRERSWKLHGKPPSREWIQRGEQSKTQGQANVATVQENATQLQEFSGFNREEIERLRSLISNLEKPSGTCSLVYSGESSSFIGLNVSDTTFAKSWVMDSGATDHVTHSPSIFFTYFPCPSSRKIATANDSLITVAGIGDVKLNPSLVLKNVLHVPTLSTNLISIKKLTQDSNCNVIFNQVLCVFQDKVSGRTIGRARERNGLYHLDLEALSQSSINKGRLPHSFLSELSLSNKEKIWLHHHRLGHPSFRVIQVLFLPLFKSLEVENFHCEVCELAKHKRVSFPVSNKRSLFPFYLVHSDIWGPSIIPNVSWARWFVSFIDDCTRVTWLFLLKQKSDVSTVLPNFFSLIRNQFGVQIKRFRSDNAKDYFNQILSPYFQREGIVHESSCVNTPQQNGVAERKNGHLLESTRALLFQTKVPKSFWGGSGPYRYSSD